MKIFMLTLGFLTRIPIPFKNYEVVSKEDFAAGIKFFPFVGLIVGLVSFCLYFVTSKISWGLFPLAAAVLGEVFVTGAFHIDGLADTCDGIYSSKDRGKMLEIMRDSRIGTNGVLAIIFDILIKIFILSELDYFLLPKAIILAPIAAKAVTPILVNSNYVQKNEGLGSVYIAQTRENERLFAIFAGSVIITLVLGVNGIIPIMFTVIGAFLFKKYIESKIGGMTGDTLGAGAEFCEILFLVSLLISVRCFI